MTDGDTFTLTQSETKYKVRLNGIDAPEHDQHFGRECTDALTKKLLGKMVRVRVVDHDRYGRYVGDVEVDNANINQELVREGFAWHYKKYSNDDSLAQAETAARAERQG